MKTIRITNKQSPFFGKTGLATKREAFKPGDETTFLVYFDGNPEFKIFWEDEVEVVRDATLPAAALLAYNQIQAKEFPVMSFVRRMRAIAERPHMMDGSATRRLRELREDGKINFTCIDNHKAIYQKS